MHEVIVEPEMELIEHEDNQQMLQQNVQKITNIIEKYARLYPAEWGWMHRRWKSRPKTDQSNQQNTVNKT